MSERKLQPDHEVELLEESGIDDRVVEARGCWTAETRAELGRLGFGRAQQIPPALVMPIYGPTGEVELYQCKPDKPRIKGGKPNKYETPGKSRMALDVHPFAREKLGDPRVPLFVTEGVKKGDCLVSRGLCTVTLIGVWNWRGTNEHGGKTILAAWEYVALNGRKVYIVFDSDVMEKPEVYAALVRLKGVLESRKATVRLIYLPSGEGGVKQGVDDYVVAGHDVDDLLELATPDLKCPPQEEEPESPYRATQSGLVYDKPTQDGSIPIPLTNFPARIVADVIRDDGAEEQRFFEIEAALNGHRYRFTIPSGRFAGMSWVPEHLGATAIVYPGSILKDHARVAIQALSDDVATRRVFTHTGWRRIGGEWRHLHAGGAIGRNGQIDSVYVELNGSLAGHTLPDPPVGEDLKAAVRASLGLRKVGPGEITVPLLCATYRAVLGDSDFTIHISGPTGEGKSELAALCQQHYGTELDARHLIAWESTENALEGIAFQAKDQLVVYDDFAPTGSAYDVQRWHKKADRVLRAKGNASGRQRMRPDTTLRPEKPPQALILSTGEDVPRGQSLRGRMLVLELGPGGLDWNELTRCQEDAANGLYTLVMSGYIRWLADIYEEVQERLKEERAELRAQASTGAQHRRTPGITADLALGLRYFLAFARESGAISAQEAIEIWEEGWCALGAAASAQLQHQVANEPTRRFKELLGAAIASGLAYVADPKGNQPGNPTAWGWREVTVGPPENERTEWRPQGNLVGWIAEDSLFLEPDAAFAAAQRQGRDSGDQLTITGRTLRKRLGERGLLLSVDEARGTLTVRKVVGGRRREVLHLPSRFLSAPSTGPDQPDPDREEPHSQEGLTPPLWSDC